MTFHGFSFHHTFIPTGGYYILFKFILILCVHTNRPVPVNDLGGQKRELGPLGLQLQMVVRLLRQAVGRECRSSVGAATLLAASVK